MAIPDVIPGEHRRGESKLECTACLLHSVSWMQCCRQAPLQLQAGACTAGPPTSACAWASRATASAAAARSSAARTASAACCCCCCCSAARRGDSAVAAAASAPACSAAATALASCRSRSSHLPSKQPRVALMGSRLARACTPSETPSGPPPHTCPLPCKCCASQRGQESKPRSTHGRLSRRACCPHRCRSCTADSCAARPSAAAAALSRS